MASTRFLLVFTSVLSLAAVLVFYIASSKTEPKALKMFEIFSRKEDVGSHSMEIPPIPGQRLTKGELYREQDGSNTDSYTGHRGQIGFFHSDACGPSNDTPPT